MKSIVLVLFLALASTGVQADDGQAYYNQTVEKFTQCADLFPMASVSMGSIDGMANSAETQTIRKFLSSGTLTSTSPKATTTLNSECSDILSGIIVGESKAYAKRFGVDLHDSLVKKESICMTQYKYAETFQGLLPFLENLDSDGLPPTAKNFIKTGEVFSQGRTPMDSQQSKICGNMMKGSLVATQFQALSGVGTGIGDAIVTFVVNEVAAIVNPATTHDLKIEEPSDISTAK